MSSNSENSPIGPTAQAESPAGLNYEISPMIQRSVEAFRRDLPALLQNKKRLGQWVAYHGDRQIGFGKRKTPLYQECLRRGLKIDEFIVRCVAPDLPDEIDPEELMDL
jgi:hypothetical protein